MFEWHLSNFQEEADNMMKTLVDAYCSKHRLFSDGPEDDKEEDMKLTPEDLRRILAMVAMKDNLSDKTYCKLLDNK